MTPLWDIQFEDDGYDGEIDFGDETPIEDDGWSGSTPSYGENDDDDTEWSEEDNEDEF